VGTRTAWLGNALTGIQMWDSQSESFVHKADINYKNVLSKISVTPGRGRTCAVGGA